MILLVKLILAHIIGDFILQPLSWVEEKKRKKLKSPKLYFHIAIHFTLLFLVLYDLSLWPIIVFIGVSHFVIDAIKLSFQKEETKRFWFFLDQILHLTAIIMAILLFTKCHFNIQDYLTEHNLLLMTCVLFLTQPVSIIMKVIFSKWNIEELTKDNQSLKDAGKYIGILERLMVFVFIITNHWEAVGFLITAKSVFRFGDLKESKHRKLTEYILIGTLISFGIAIMVGFIFQNLAL